MLLQGQLISPGVGVVLLAEDHLGRARLLIPAPELRQIAPRRLRQTVNKVITGHRLPVEPLEIQRGAGMERLGPEQGM